MKGNKCEFCSIGTFNPVPANKFSCERCEPGKTTRTKGATHYTDCVQIEESEVIEDNTYLIIIGAVVGFFVLLIILLWCICLYNKKRRREREDHQRALKRQKHARDEEDRRLRHEEMIRKREKERRKQESYDMNRHNMVSFNDEDDDQPANHTQADPPASTKSKKAPQPPGTRFKIVFFSFIFSLVVAICLSAKLRKMFVNRAKEWKLRVLKVRVEAKLKLIVAPKMTVVQNHLSRKKKTNRKWDRVNRTLIWRKLRVVSWREVIVRNQRVFLEKFRSMKKVKVSANQNAFKS